MCRDKPSMEYALGARKNTRLAKLRDILSERKSLHIKDAADLLHVSEMTVRRDIRESTNNFKYLGGYIVLSDTLLHQTPYPYDLSQAAATHKAEKRRACAHCLPYIEHGKMIYVDCGTTLEQLFELLAKDMELTVVCSSLNIADRTLRRSNLKLILVGGFYDTATASFFGMNAEAVFQELVIETGFFTASGVDRDLGVMCTSFQEVAQKRAAMARCHKRILVADNSKFGKIHKARFGQMEDFDPIITEDGPQHF